jgi:CO/xanthine dehydrogenase Mo-binding subunit
VILPAAVIASAIQDATGRRLYRLPLRPDRVVGLVP